MAEEDSMMSLKAFILCGGQGMRLREHTEARPKPMVEVGGRPILWHIMKTYAHYGINDFVLCLGYKGNMIKDYFLNYEARNCDFTVTLGPGQAVEVHRSHHNEDGWRVTLCETGEDAMTGARIKRASRYLEPDEQTFCVTYGDGLIDMDLRAVVAFHEAHPGVATMTAVRPPSRFGELQHQDGRVVVFNEKPQVSEGLINGGYLVFDRAFLDYLSEDSPCVMERDGLGRCAEDGRLYAYEHNGYWQCMDTYRDWLHLENQWNSGRAPWKAWP
jgi:glucose-1-phosphate cytidylyltransferase